ncbi:MAG: aspartyl/asparaginyl beta-hydroxylase domain-containing protein, partial [Gammaproteobacteria bacterium]|nr:aspartyl/asparaginyl beta-hydroxylase domain-containing protein [Gammaproteobacteria bacterium]
NTKLTVHLPLITPGNGALKVAGEARTWKTGELLLFDDSFEHEAYNNSDQTRVVLIFKVWHPGISLEEKTTLEAIINAGDDFYQQMRGYAGHAADLI